MRFSFVTLAALLLSSALAQTEGIPACALQCTFQTLPQTQCGSATNVSCICGNQDFQRLVYQCYLNSCTPAELQAAITQGGTICQAIGTPIPTDGTAPSGVTTPANFTAAASSTGPASQSASASSLPGSATSAPSSAGASSPPAGSSAAQGGSAAPAPSSARSGASTVVAAGVLALLGAGAAVLVL